MPVSGHILEIGSGTGEHAAHIAGAAPGLDWQPSDPDPASRRSIDAWAAHGALAGLRPALDLDVTAPHWWRAITPDLAGMVSINMIHIAPFAAAEGLFAGAAALLEQAAAARLMLYGPFLREGISAPSNLDFDASLKSRDPAWGVRDLDREIIPLAAGNGFAPAAIIEMPANNLTVLFARR